MNASTTAFGLSRIGQIAINVKDLDRATDFYRDTLGLRFLFKAPPGMAFFDAGGIRLLLGKAETPEHDHPSSILYFNVDDIRLAHEALKGRGAAFIDEPHIVHKTPQYDLWMVFLRDSEGNVMALMEEKKGVGSGEEKGE